MLMNEKTRKLVEAATGVALDAKDWGSVRQSLRCLIQGWRLVDWQLTPNAAPEMSGEEALTALLNAMRDYHCGPVEAGRRLIASAPVG